MPAAERDHLLRWRPRQRAQRTESTPRALPSGAASQPTPSRHPACSSPTLGLTASSDYTPNECPNHLVHAQHGFAMLRINGGGGGIRTHGRVAPTRHFQCRTFGHSATPPAPKPLRMPRPDLPSSFRPNRLAHGQHGQAMLRMKDKWRRGEDLNPRGTCAPIRFRVGRLQPGSATPPRSLLNYLRRVPDLHTFAA